MNENSDKQNWMTYVGFATKKNLKTKACLKPA